MSSGTHYIVARMTPWPLPPRMLLGHSRPFRRISLMTREARTLLDASGCIDYQFFSIVKEGHGINVLPITSHMSTLEVSISKSYLAGIALSESAHEQSATAKLPLKEFSLLTVKGCDCEVLIVRCDELSGGTDRLAVIVAMVVNDEGQMWFMSSCWCKMAW